MERSFDLGRSRNSGAYAEGARQLILDLGRSLESRINTGPGRQPRASINGVPAETRWGGTTLAFLSAVGLGAALTLRLPQALEIEANLVTCYALTTFCLRSSQARYSRRR